MLRSSSLILIAMFLVSCAAPGPGVCDCRARKVAQAKADLEKKTTEAGCTAQ